MSTSDGLLGIPFPPFEGSFTPWDCQYSPLIIPPQEPVFSPITPQEPIMSNLGSQNSNSNSTWDCQGSPFTFPNQELVFSPINPQEPIMSNSGSQNSNSNTTWDCQHFPFTFPNQAPVFSSITPQEPVMSNSGSENSNSKNVVSISGSDDPSRSTFYTNEQKRRRMISNRESAKRSRLRKQRHLENLRNQLNRMRILNEELMNMMRIFTHHYRVVQRDNDRLRSESVLLRQKLWDIRQILLVEQLQQLFSSSAWPCNDVTYIEQQNPPSLVIEGPLIG